MRFRDILVHLDGTERAETGSGWPSPWPDATRPTSPGFT